MRVSKFCEHCRFQFYSYVDTVNYKLYRFDLFDLYNNNEIEFIAQSCRSSSFIRPIPFSKYFDMESGTECLKIYEGLHACPNCNRIIFDGEKEIMKFLDQLK